MGRCFTTSSINNVSILRASAKNDRPILEEYKTFSAFSPLRLKKPNNVCPGGGLVVQKRRAKPFLNNLSKTTTTRSTTFLRNFFAARKRVWAVKGVVKNMAGIVTRSTKKGIGKQGHPLAHKGYSARLDTNIAGVGRVTE